jgi:hypothetical protein
MGKAVILCISWALMASCNKELQTFAYPSNEKMALSKPLKNSLATSHRAEMH